MITGIEINGAFNWQEAQASFAFIHYGSGTANVNPAFSTNIAEAVARKIPFGPIFEIKPEKSFKKQAEVVSNLFGYPLPPVVLVSTSAGLTKQKLMDYLQKFFNLVYSLSGEKRPIIATNIGFWNSSVARNDFAKRHTLMIYRWTNASDPGEPYDWSDINNPVRWTLWNYGKSSSGIGLYRFNGESAQFKRLFGVDPVDVDDPQLPPPIDPTKAVTKYRSNMRKSPGGDILVIVDPGLEFEIVGKEDDHYKVVVYFREDVVDVS